MSDYGVMPGRYPAIIKTYDSARRTCRVEIPGLTDGGDVLPEAELEYPLGDKSRAGTHTTEIEVLPGDTVWVAFIGGDSRYPIITGWRNPQAGNSTGWRRFHHANVELLAEAVMRLIAGGDVLLQAGGTLMIKASHVAIESTTLTHNGVNVGNTHAHGGILPGSASTDVPH
ncbi:hypothetical protein BH10PSE16_BH10PSE16_00780 [soil metagenome]